MYGVVTQLLQPFTLGWLLTLGALGYLWWKDRGLRRRLLVLTVPLLGLLLLCTPAVSHLALGSLEWQYAPLVERPADADAIVVLSGSFRPPDAARPKPELAEDTLFRCLYGLALYQQGKPCPLVLTGGPNEPRTPDVSVAAVMRDFLVEKGVPATNLILEEQSLSTHENAAGCREVLRPRGVRRIVLVTDATHMFRAVRCFQKEGFEVIPAPCNFRLSPFGWSLLSFLPNAHAPRGCDRAYHEWLGTLWYWWNDWV